MFNYNTISENIILPLSDLVMKRQISSILQFLLKSQWWSKKELYDYQTNMLRKILIHAYKNVPYYTDLFNSIKLIPDEFFQISDLKNIPILSKEDIRNNYDKLLAKNFEVKEKYINYSSGSTGEPLKYVRSDWSYSFLKASNIRGLYWQGYRLGDRIAIINQNPRDNFEKKLQDKITNTQYINAWELSEKFLEQTVALLKKIKPKVIYTYPDPILILAEYLIKNKLNINLEFINTSGNILYNEARQKIQKAFNCKVYDSYSCEGTPIIFECNTQKCYHSASEYGITELELDLQNIDSGKIGRHITTDLQNYVMPFIRYDTQDLIELSKDICDCGRNLLEVKNIIGRDTDIITSANNKSFIVHNFTIYFEYFEEIRHFQVEQINKTKILFKLVLKNKFNKNIINQIKEFWQKEFGDETEIVINLVDTIALSNSGKRRIIVNKIKKDY